MPIDIATKIYAGSMSQKPIDEDLVKVDDNPTKKAVANITPNSNVILLIIFTILFQPVCRA